MIAIPFIFKHLMIWAAVEIIFDPGVYVIKYDKAPGIIYDSNDKSWAVPSYDKAKHIVKCIQYDNVKCLRGN